MSGEFLWSGLGLIAPLGARVSGTVCDGVNGVSIDTRTLAKDDLFVALKGDNGDGHAFVRAAFEKGAAAALVDEVHAAELAGSGPLYVVKDTLRGLENLGRASRAREKARIAAITGSVGKTSTKEALKLVLERQGKTHASAASYNNHWGVPLSLARMPADARFGVFEIGMNHANEITPLAAMVSPQVAIITKVAPVHLEHFESVEKIALAKSEIFSGLVNGGLAILPRDDAHYQFLAEQASASPAGFVLSFGMHEDADARLIQATASGTGSRIEAKILGDELIYDLGAPGRHNAENSLAVLLAARAMGADIHQAAKDLAQFHAPKGRGKRIALNMIGGPALLIDESYNANPVSMRAAIELLGVASAERKIAVLGDMLELGATSRDLHAGLAEDVLRNNIDLVFVAGPMMRALSEALPADKIAAVGETSADIEKDLIFCVRAGDAVMVKGSAGSKMSRLVAALEKEYAPAPDSTAKG